MEHLLEDTSSSEDIKKFEKQYYQELNDQNLSGQTQFEYAWCLVRSRYSPDVRKGVKMLETLFTDNNEGGKRDYLFYMAVGYARLKEYSECLRYCKVLLEKEPNNGQVRELHDYVKKKMEKEGLLGMAMVGGAAVAIGGLVTLGVALARK